MGWTSTGDPYANVGDSALSFDSQEAAISFAERHGWDYTVCLFVLLVNKLSKLYTFRSFVKGRELVLRHFSECLEHLPNGRRYRFSTVC